MVDGDGKGGDGGERRIGPLADAALKLPQHRHVPKYLRAGCHASGWAESAAHVKSEKEDRQ